MKYTVRFLQKTGYKGYQRHCWTGNVLETRYPLDQVAWAANHKPERLVFTRDDLQGLVRVSLKNKDAWVPSSNLEFYIERPMTPAELAEAERRLAASGVMVERRL